MSLGLSAILPNLGQGLNNTGFLFGAGTSVEAGYPLMADLTRDVVAALSSCEGELLAEALEAAGLTFDRDSAAPNIEELCDRVIEHATNSGKPDFQRLEARLRSLIVERLLAVAAPDLTHHVRFLTALKKRAFGFPCCVWIITTNYDVLIEMAAARCQIPVENGFNGTVERHFDSTLFTTSRGTSSGGRFAPSPGLTIKLIKLHGSISWFSRSNEFYETHPAALTGDSNRLLILPRRRKVMDTLNPPFDTLFSLASRALGGECRYLVSAGFSFGDEHITQQLLLPPLRMSRCRLFCLAKDEPVGIAPLKYLPTFSAAFQHHAYSQGAETSGGTDLWRFSAFVDLFR